MNHFHDALLRPHATSGGPFLLLPDGDVVTWRDHVARSADYAAGLVVLGLRPADRVVVRAAKTPPTLALMHGIIRAGGVVVPFAPSWDTVATAERAAQIRPVLLIEDDSPGRVPQAGIHTLVLGRDGSGIGGDGTGFADVRRGQGDPAVICYTSGTTNAPKGCLLSHGNLVSNAQALARAWAVSDKDVITHVMPIYHTHGLLICTNIAMAAGAGMAFLPGTDHPGFAAALARSTVYMGTPAHYAGFLEQGLTRADLPRMRLCLSGGAPLSGRVLDAFEAATGQRVLERHGMTEAGISTSNPLDGPRRAGTVGPAIEGIEIRIVAPGDGRLVAPGGTGRVQFRGPNICKGYWEMPEKTAEVFLPGGWFDTGDIGRLLPDGYLEIQGRVQDLIRTATGYLNARHIELALEDLPDVREAAVVGVPVGDTIQVLAVVTGDVPDPEALRLGLPDAARPDRIIVAESLPRNATGKMQKRLLRQAHAGAFARQGADM